MKKKDLFTGVTAKSTTKKSYREITAKKIKRERERVPSLFLSKSKKTSRNSEICSGVRF